MERIFLSRRKKNKNKKTLLLAEFLDDASFFEGLVGSVLINSADCLSGEGDDHRLVELRYENPLFLEIHLPAGLARRVELRGTSAV